MDTPEAPPDRVFVDKTARAFEANLRQKIEAQGMTARWVCGQMKGPRGPCTSIRLGAFRGDTLHAVCYPNRRGSCHMSTNDAAYYRPWDGPLPQNPPEHNGT